MQYHMWYGLLDLLQCGAHSTLRKEEFWALDSVSLHIDKPGIYGVAGKNGSGKTTFLKILSQIYQPDKGVAELQGRYYSIFDIHGGLFKNVSVRENVFLLGTLLGVSPEKIQFSLDEFFAFSELGDVASKPVGFLSPGMKVRLGISIITIVKPDIMLIDEVLANADPSFQDRCLKYLKGLSSSTIVLLASHNRELIRENADTLILFDRGTIEYMGDDMDKLCFS